jgi:hypothetical protein
MKRTKQNKPTRQNCVNKRDNADEAAPQTATAIAMEVAVEEAVAVPVAEAAVYPEPCFTVVIFNTFFGPDSDPPSCTFRWRNAPFAAYEDACNEAKAKAFEAVAPGHTLVAYREGEKHTGYQGEYEVLYEISDEESCIRFCVTTKYTDEDFREWEE